MHICEYVKMQAAATAAAERISFCDLLIVGWIGSPDLLGTQQNASMGNRSSDVR